MSGETVLAFSRKMNSTPLERAMEVESDRRLFGSLGSGSVFGIAFLTLALSWQIPHYRPVLHPDLARSKPDRPDVPFTVKPPVDYHGSIKEKRIVKKHPKPGQAGERAARPRTQYPAQKDPGTLGTKVITSNRGDNKYGAYDLLGKSVTHIDLDKLTQFGSLTRTDKTRIGGRRGRETTEFNNGYNEGGTGGDGSIGIEMPGMPDAAIPTSMKHPKGIGKPIEVDYVQNTTVRSTASILAVIRSRSPGLRHLYNAHLKMSPGMAGKITLRFAIAPSGQVVDVGLASSTTSAPAFDAQVMDKVMEWRFEAVKAAGNDIVTVPFNFSE